MSHRSNRILAWLDLTPQLTLITRIFFLIKQTNRNVNPKPHWRLNWNREAQTKLCLGILSTIVSKNIAAMLQKILHPLFYKTPQCFLRLAFFHFLHQVAVFLSLHLSYNALAASEMLRYSCFFLLYYLLFLCRTSNSVTITTVTTLQDQREIFYIAIVLTMQDDSF